MARTQSRPAAAGASALPASFSFSPARLELLHDVLPEAERTRLALSALLELLHGCNPAHPLTAGGLIRLLEPVASGLDMVCGDLHTVTGTVSPQLTEH